MKLKKIVYRLFSQQVYNLIRHEYSSYKFKLQKSRVSQCPLCESLWMTKCITHTVGVQHEPTKTTQISRYAQPLIIYNINDFHIKPFVLQWNISTVVSHFTGLRIHKFIFNFSNLIYLFIRKSPQIVFIFRTQVNMKSCNFFS